MVEQYYTTVHKQRHHEGKRMFMRCSSEFVHFNNCSCRDDRLVSIHPCDKVDARLPESLRMMEARKQSVKGQASLSRRKEVLPWDGTMKNVTASLLWRNREPLF